MTKNIAVFCDGTGQSANNKYPTNIYKMYTSCNPILDCVFYDPGVGTGLRKITGMLGGKGFSRNIIECYKFIAQNYKSGDKVFLFGFSRGAATVRSLASFINYFGIVTNEELLLKCWEMYQSYDGDYDRWQINDFSQVADLMEKNHIKPVDITMLGVFDTVAALGVPNKFLSSILDRVPTLQHKFHDFKLAKNVNYGFQALALNEKRSVFSPVLWDKSERVEQVWFTGNHADIGGGYKEYALSNITLECMSDKAKELGLNIEITNDHACLSPVVIHDETKGLFGKLFRKSRRAWNVKKNGPISIHQSVKVKNINRLIDIVNA